MTLPSSGNKIVAFSYKTSYYQVDNPAKSGDNSLLLKLVRVNHLLTGYFSTNGYNWIQVGSSIDVTDMDNLQPNYNAWTGNRQGLFVQGRSSADFDYYIYRDAYTPILAECPANQYGTTASIRTNVVRSLDYIHDGDWALYAGVEFGNNEYLKKADSLTITASCNSSGGVVEVWLDSLDSNTKIAECSIGNTGSWDTYKTFTTNVLFPISGNHDVYLKFRGTGSDRLFMLQWLTFIDKSNPETSVNDLRSGQFPYGFVLDQNYPNPFNPGTAIRFDLPAASFVTLRVYDALGREVATLIEGEKPEGSHTVHWNAHNLPSGAYVYRIVAGDYFDSKKMLLTK